MQLMGQLWKINLSWNVNVLDTIFVHAKKETRAENDLLESDLTFKYKRALLTKERAESNRNSGLSDLLWSKISLRITSFLELNILRYTQETHS